MNHAIRSVASAVFGLCMATGSPTASAQVNINIGAAPDCPYGYYDYEPYACAPYGYYGSGWFNGGVFIGAGPWFRGPDRFRGHVNRDFDGRYGYRGPLPHFGERPDPSNRLDRIRDFRGNEMRDGRGHSSEGRR
jgi:hypothetical protein